MKSKFTYLGLMAILFSACSTGSYVSNSYVDDIYFNPGEVPPPVTSTAKTTTKAVQQKPENKIVLNETGENANESNALNNYIFEGSEGNEVTVIENNESVDYGADTITYYEDGELQYLINNYYDDNGNVDFAYRIQQFHNPFFYDPFYWDTWYYDPYWSIGFNWGWGYPYYGYGYGYPYYGWGYPGYGWGYPGYGWGYYPPYYPGYPGYYPPIYVDSDNYKYGQRRSTGTNVDRNYRNSSGSVAQSTSGRNKSAGTEVEGSGGSSRNATSSSGRRDGSTGNNVNTKSNIPNSNVLTERRRSTGEGIYSRQSGSENNAGSVANPNSINNSGRNQTQSYSRPGASTQGRSYTRPSNSSSSVSSQPRVVNQNSSAISTGSGYSQPKSTSTYNQSYRSSSTYNRSSSTGTSSRSYSSPSSSGNYRSSSSSGSGSYSTGSSGSSVRSSSSYSSGSSGSSYSGGSSGSSSGGGGGGSRSSGGGSSSSGRR